MTVDSCICIHSYSYDFVCETHESTIKKIESSRDNFPKNI
jgi:hypothetical protein